MRKIIVLLLILIFILTINISCYAKVNVNVPNDIRIGLFYGSSAKSQVKLSSPGGIEIGVMKNGEFVYEDETNKGEEIVVTKSSKAGAIYIDGYGDIGSPTEYPYFKSLEKDGLCLIVIDGKKYRGNVEIRRLSDSDMTIINHLSMQEYLYGVVPREIGGNSPIEAVKAQAIVARTYAAKNYNKQMKLGFNLKPNSEDQAYGGYEWEVANSNKGVDDTNGMVAVYNGTLINGNYFSTSGGYTESSENVWTSAVDYLKAVPDTYEPEVTGNTSWVVTMSSQEVKSSLAKYGVNVGEVLDLVPTQFTDAGRVLELKIIGSNGEKVISKSNVRSYLGLKSQWYTINSEAPIVKTSELASPKVEEQKAVEPVDEMPSQTEDTTTKDDKWYLKTGDEETTNKTIDYSSDEKNYVKEYDDGIVEKEKKEMKPLLAFFVNKITNPFGENVSRTAVYKAVSSNKTFTFRGRGWGHAVGMSQNGAKGMAKAGFSAEDIIKWYYTGVDVVK